jgi:hypothetical protein
LLGVALAIALTVIQDSTIAGWHPFIHAILGRLKVRNGGFGKGITSLFYYRQLLRFYASYLPFLLLAGGLFVCALRRGGRWNRDLRPFPKGSEMVVAVALLALCADHIVLSNHTALHIFTTLNALPPLAILVGISITAYLETSQRVRRDGIVVCMALALCIGASIFEYEYAYRNRPHPRFFFNESASAINAASEQSDVIFATGNRFQMAAEFIVPEMLYYLRRNVEVVASEADAYLYLANHPFRRGILARLNRDFSVAEIKVLEKPVPAGSP